MPIRNPTTTISRFALTLDGAQAGFLNSVDGGGIEAEVVKESLGQSHFVKKHIGSPKYEPFAAEVDFSMSRSVYDWIAATWSGKQQPKNGSVITADRTYKSVKEQEFFNAILTEVTIPACDATSKARNAPITIKIAPEYTRTNNGGGRLEVEKIRAPKPQQWLAANFRLDIDGLDCRKVIAVDSFTVRQLALQHDAGGRDYENEVPQVDFPNLKITLRETDAQTWRDWFEDFVVKGNCDESREKSGRLMFLSPTGNPLASIQFYNLGIYRMATGVVNGDGAKYLQIELYCEHMELQVAR